ncbi:malonyl CoA-acyl carrier protein transacylase [Bdellovibrio bacteriovorus]|uniref:Malonyl CoA-acyl carrier protein transacylase n=1 Tax=Bdellovibrio bacteriovorus TaxID=959 RepID=A0A150WJI5_BDEBC|nr:ACP S-malonyltransferase [Bdellovibrio bacteriovorus]KYG63928.1 malonyl CoA-acyl carrier protein transacylase [Bdellovibrio bacteriovorus]
MFTLAFPGQGSQQPGMGRFLFDNFGIAKETFEEGSEALKQDMKKLCFEGSEADLALTENTQPALLLVSTATQRVLNKEFNIKVQSAAGHSIGEYAALVAAGVTRFDESMRAVRTRGQAMQSAVPVGKGGMVAMLGLEPDQVETLCQWVVKNSGAGPLSAANFNSPGQIVISGSQNAINWMKDNFKPEAVWGADAPKRAKMIPLSVSAPFHCEMMKPAEDKMREVLTAMEFKTAAFPIVQNFHAKLETDGSVLRENLIRQVSAPVRWTQSMEVLKSQGHSQIIECGAGKVVQGLLKKIDGEFFKVFTTTSMEDIKTIEDFLKASSH